MCKIKQTIKIYTYRVHNVGGVSFKYLVSQSMDRGPYTVDYIANIEINKKSDAQYSVIFKFSRNMNNGFPKANYLGYLREGIFISMSEFKKVIKNYFATQEGTCCFKDSPEKNIKIDITKLEDKTLDYANEFIKIDEYKNYIAIIDNTIKSAKPTIKKIKNQKEIESYYLRVNMEYSNSSKSIDDVVLSLDANYIHMKILKDNVEKNAGFRLVSTATK